MSDYEEITRTFCKIENNAKTKGLGDGLSSGRDVNFQKYFDKGFREGLHNGFAIGKYKGALLGEFAIKNIPIDQISLLAQPKGGWCQVCEKKLQEKSISEVVAQQNQANNKNFLDLYCMYSKKITEKNFEDYFLNKSTQNY